MSVISEDNDREERIIMEIVVDAYGMEERAMGWYYYLEEKIVFPFDAECFAIDNRSPLIIGERVTVSCMTGEGNWTQGQDIYVEISWKDRIFSVPLAQLKPLDADEDTVEAISDWHYLERTWIFILMNNLPLIKYNIKLYKSNLRIINLFTFI